MQLQSIKKGSLSITDFYSKMKLIANNLIVVECLVTDKDMILHILSGPGPEYDHVVVSTTASTISLALEEIYPILLTHESRMDQYNSIGTIDVINPTTNYVTITKEIDQTIILIETTTITPPSQETTEGEAEVDQKEEEILQSLYARYTVNMGTVLCVTINLKKLLCLKTPKDH